MSDWHAQLEQALPQSVRFDQMLAPKVAFRIGGPAEAWVEPTRPDELASALRIAREHGVRVTLLGSGTNILVSDQGIRGMTIRLRGELAEVRVDEIDEHRGRVRAGAGALNAKLVAQALDADLVGIEFLATIPGTFGGALIMNAGAHGGEIGPFVDRVELLDTDLVEVSRPGDGCGFAYRRSGFARGEVLLGATLVVPRGAAAAARAHLKEMREHRRHTQPIGQPNAGSIFKNPPGDYAGRLIEGCGLKGAREGKARISELHANFIVNEGGATAAEVCALAKRVQEVVRDQRGVELEWEVRRLGFETESL